MESKTKKGGRKRICKCTRKYAMGRVSKGVCRGGKGAKPPPRPVNSELSHFSNLKLKSEEY